MVRIVRDWIIDLNRSFLKEEGPSNSALVAIASSCYDGRFLFDLIAGVLSLKNISFQTIEIIAGHLGDRKLKWCWMFLCACQPPFCDPIDLIPDKYDYN